MQDYKLIRILQVLTDKELREVRDFLKDSKGNSSSIELFQVLCQFHPKFDSPKLTKDFLYKKLFPKQVYNDGKMRKQLTQLSQQIEDYLISKELGNSGEIRAKLLAKALGSRNGYGLFLETVESRLRELDKRPVRGRDYFREYYELCDMVYFHPESDKLVKRNDYVKKALANFERYFTLVTLQNRADNIVRSRLIKEHSHSHYIDQARKVTQMPDFLNYRTILLFDQIVNLLEGEEVEDLEQLKSNAIETFKELSQFEQDFVLNLLRNYAVPLSNGGSMLHTKFILDLFKLELEKGFIANTISAGAFMNIVTVGLAAEELEWVESFMTKYKLFLPDTERELTFNYCVGIWYYQKGVKNKNLGDLYSAMKSINMIPTRSGAKYELRARVALLRVHFEIFSLGKESFDELLSQFRNFERHITSSSEYSVPVRNYYLEFLRYFKSLSKIMGQPNLDRNLINALLEKMMKDENSFILKSWLIGKAKELAC